MEREQKLGEVLGQRWAKLKKGNRKRWASGARHGIDREKGIESWRSIATLSFCCGRKSSAPAGARARVSHAPLQLAALAAREGTLGVPLYLGLVQLVSLYQTRDGGNPLLNFAPNFQVCSVLPLCRQFHLQKCPFVSLPSG